MLRATAGSSSWARTDAAFGFLVADLQEAVAELQEAVAELRAAGIAVDEPDENERYRYVHFRAPDGKLYELVEER